MAEDKISGIIDDRAVESELKALDTRLDALASRLKSFPVINLGGKANLKELRQATADYEKALQNLNKAAKDVEAQTQRLEKTKQASLKTDQEKAKLAKEEAKADVESSRAKKEKIKVQKEELSFEEALARQKKRGLSDAAAEAKIAAQLTNEYAILNKALIDSEIKYKNLALTKGFDHEATLEQLKDAQSIRAVLDKVDKSLNNNQRNVGNYKSAFDGLGISFTQVARELPSLAINAQTFFLAISNNLPMVFDEIGKARRELQAMREQGEKAPSLFSKIAKSAFSLQVGLSILVTLFTVFGGKIFDAISGLFGYGDALEKAKESTARYQKAQLELIRTQQELNELYRDPINDIDRLEKNLTIAQNLNKSKGDLLEIERKIAEQRALTANQEFLNTGGFDTLSNLKNDLAEASRELQSLKSLLLDPTLQGEDAQENIQKRIERKQITVDLFKKQFDDQLKIVRENYAALTDLANKQNEIEQYNREQKLLKETEFAKIEAQLIIDKNERILADEKSFEDKRAAALRQRAAERKKIIEADLRNEKEDPKNKNLDGSFTAEALVAIKKANAEIIKIDKDLQVDLINNREEFYRRRLSAELNIYKAEAEFAANQFKKISATESTSIDLRLSSFAEFYQRQQDLILKDHDFQIETKILTAKEIEEIDKETSRKLKELSEQSIQEVSQIVVSSAQFELDFAKTISELKLSEEKKALIKSLANKEKFAGIASQKERDLLKKNLQAQIGSDLALQLRTDVTAEHKIDAMKRVYENQKKLNDLSVEDEQMTADEKERINQRLRGTLINLAQETQDAIFQIIINSLQRQIDSLEERQKQIDKKKELDINNVNQLGLAEEERIKRIAAIEKEAAFQKELLEKRAGSLKEKQARFEKAANIASIISATAVAVMNALATKPFQVGIALAAIAGATGAVQLAAAASAPIPKYEKGGRAKAGLGIIGEIGPELITEPSGRQYLSPGVPTLMQFKGNEMITPAKLTQDILNASTMRAISDMPVKKGITENDVNFYVLQDIVRELRIGNRKSTSNNVNVSVDGWFYKHFKS